MKAILFDLDGTLTDPKEGITRCLAHALECLALEPPPLAEMTWAIGPPLRASLARLIGSEERAAVEKALGHYRERFADIGLFENAVYAGIPEALASLGDARLFVATSKPLVYAERILRHFDLDRHFTAIHGCELDGTREDKRELLAHLLPHHGIDPRDAVMIGDRGVDMRAAVHHGAAALGALWGYGDEPELRAHGAHALCADPFGLPAAIDALRATSY